MMGWHKSLKDIEKNAEHYKALGETMIFMDSEDPDLPWAEVTSVESGGGVRLNTPTGFYCIVERDGLTLKWSVDFEARNANGRSVSLFDRDRLREVSMKLAPEGRRALADFLETQVLPKLAQTTAEWREYLNKQLDSEDCVRGLIAYAKAASP